MWKEDVLAYRRAAQELGISVAIERSRSGQGAHAWIFFENPIPARMARSLGTLILAKSCELNIRLSLESYDRFFPSQDYLPKGGFGNLIALPLQKLPRQEGNSCFLDEELNPHADQWAYLSGVRRLSIDELRDILKQNLPTEDHKCRPEGFADISWVNDKAILEKTISEKIDHLLHGKTVEVTFGSMLSIALEALPGKIVAKLKKIASFPNPEFYKRQKMRMQTYPHPRFIFSGELRPEEIILPRGVLDEVTSIFTTAGARVIIRDERIAKRKLKVEFSGKLTKAQTTAVKCAKAHDLGIFCAPPGAGKTVMGCAIISQRKVSTLILVHRQHLLDQWKKQIVKFLGIPVKEIGTMSGSKKKLTGKIDVASLLSLAKVDDLSEIIESYSQIIIDECHHIPAKSFEATLKQFPSRYLLGLTATPYRKDGLEKILFQQCGPIRHTMSSIDDGLLAKSVEIFETGFTPPDEIGHHPPYHALIHCLAHDESRNELIVDKIIDLLSKCAFPLVISDRKDHLDVLQKMLQAKFSLTLAVTEVVRLDGDSTSKQRRNALEQMGTFRAKSIPVVLMSTGALIGEGFDLPELDALVLATPLSFEGRMVQYAGRIQRLAEGKSNAQIMDFVDSCSGMLVKMYRNRLKAYRKMGYSIREPNGFFGIRRFFSEN